MLMVRVRRSLRARRLKGSRWQVPVQQPSPLVAALWLPRTTAASDAAALLAQALAAAEPHGLPPWAAFLDSRSGPFTVCKLVANEFGMIICRICQGWTLHGTVYDTDNGREMSSSAGEDLSPVCRPSRLPAGCLWVTAHQQTGQQPLPAVRQGRQLVRLSLSNAPGWHTPQPRLPEQSRPLLSDSRGMRGRQLHSLVAVCRVAMHTGQPSR